MSRLAVIAALAQIVAFLPTRADATVEGFIDYTVPYYHRQTGDICLRSLPMLGEFGVPQAVVMRGSLAPTQVLSQSSTGIRYENINLAGTSPAMKGAHVSDAVQGDGVYSYSMTLDVTGLSSSNGNTVVGRTATVQAAKLFLISMAENMQRLSPTNWYLRVAFVGLPSQAGLPGTPLYATTRWAYGPASPLLANYKKELINVSGTCR